MTHEILVPLGIALAALLVTSWYTLRLSRDLATARAALDDRARLRDTYLATIVDNSADAIISQDLDGIVTSWNKGAEKIFGYRADEMVGSPIVKFLPSDRSDEDERILNTVRGGESVPVFDTVRVTKDGRRLDVAIAASPILDADGRVVGVSKVARDITRRKRAEEERNRAVDALRTAEERMRFALETANVGIWDMDFASGKLEWSGILEALYGYAPGTFPGTFDAFVSRIHPDDRERMMRTMQTAEKDGKDFSMQHRALRPDGSERAIQAAGRILLDGNGKPVRGIGLSIDVTSQRLLEQQFQQAQKMEAVGRLAGGIAHDFNNLLTAILGYCELLLEDVPEDASTRGPLTEIQHAGTRAAALTKQLLAFSRKQIVEPKLFDLNDAVEQMRPMLERLIGEDIVITVRGTKTPATVLADRGQIEQVIMNLAVNARDAMPFGGALLIEIAHVELDDDYAAKHVSAKPGAYVALIVTDTGSGMTPDVQQHLFEPFFTTKEKGKGTGLGLATVHGIVSRSGGSIGVYSELGKGTAFRVYLPAVNAVAVPEPAPAPARAIPAHTGNAAVLVVDDAEGLRQLARRILERNGYKVFTAANAKEGLALFREHSDIEILLTDVVMPGASGPALTRELTAIRPSLCVIYMSGYTDDAISHHGVLMAGAAFLEKPFTASSLMRKIHDIHHPRA